MSRYPVLVPIPRPKPCIVVNRNGRCPLYVRGEYVTAPFESDGPTVLTLIPSVVLR